MSADENSETNTSASSDESEDIALTGLVATREKRKTAGNKYEATLGNYEDESLQAIFAEEDGESDEYESSEAEDDDAAMESSSSDEDTGPTTAGGAEDLEGEKELKRAERADQNRKRKLQQARLTVPAFAKKQKRVQLAEKTHADDGSSSALEAPAAKQKLDRKKNRTSGADLPTRKSARASAVAFRETVSVNLQESAERSRKHKTALHETIKRERAARRTDLTPEERLEKCKLIEKETARELGRFEREEAERVRLREEALMAKRRRTLEGPLFRDLSTSALFENGKLKIDRLQHGSQAIEDILNEYELQQAELATDSVAEHVVDDSILQSASSIAAPMNQTLADGIELVSEPTASTHHNSLLGDIDKGTPQSSDPAKSAALEQSTATRETELSRSNVRPGDDRVVSLEPDQDTSIKMESTEDYSGDTSQRVEGSTASAEAPTSPMIREHALTSSITQEHGGVILPNSHDDNHIHTLASDALGALSDQPPQPEAGISEPLVREQAQRHTITLEEFPQLQGITARRPKATSVLEPTAVAQILMPDSYPSFTDDEASYLRKIRKLKQELHPKQLCALTSWQGKYKDPKTGIVYADVPAYKMLQRLIAGGCHWNGMLECWSAPFVGMIGRPAHGVPDDFDVSPKSS